MLASEDIYLDSAKMTMRGYLQTFYDIGETEIPQKTVSAGLGCVLIERHILERFAFRSDNSFKFHHDTLFAQDLWENDIENMYVPIMCRHENVTWDIQRKIIKQGN